MSTLKHALATLIAPLAVLCAPCAAQAGPNGSGLAFTQQVAWQRQHTVTVRVTDVMDKDQKKAVKRAVGAVRGVQRVEIDVKQRVISAIPLMNRSVDPAAVRAAVSSAGCHVADA